IVAAQLAGQAGCFLIHPWPQRRNVNIRLAEHGFCGFAQRHHQPVFAYRETNAWGRRSAKGFGEPVITSSAEDGILRAQSPVRELECRPGVVIKAANEAVIYVKLDTYRLQNLLHLLEVLATRFVE